MFRHASGQHTGTTNQEMEVRAIVEAVKMADGPTTVVSDHERIVGIARRRMKPADVQAAMGRAYAAAAGKDVEFVWKKRDQSLGSRLAHQIARDAAKGRSV